MSGSRNETCGCADLMRRIMTPDFYQYAFTTLSGGIPAARAALFYFYDGGKTSLNLEHAFGFERNLRGMPLSPALEGICGKVFASGRSEVISDAPHLKRFTKEMKPLTEVVRFDDGGCYYEPSSLLVSPITVNSAPDGLITATVGSGPQIEVKPLTELGDDGISVRWSTGDKIALWALNAEGETILDGTQFALWHYDQDYDAAKFTAQIEPMAEGTYDYYALSPIPSSVSGTTASYVIASEQKGVFDGRYDIMIASPVKGAGALQEGDNSELINFRFTHKVHVLKIEIASNALGEPIEALELTFPRAIAGTMNADIRDAEAAPTLTGGVNKLTLRPSAAVDAGSTLMAVSAEAVSALLSRMAFRCLHRRRSLASKRQLG